MKFEVSSEVRETLVRWSPRGRQVFDELMEDAKSDLQRELLQRAVLAGHTAGEVHAFADELRTLSDDECFESCTFGADVPGEYTVSQLLRAEADPLFAFEMKGGALSPSDDDDGAPRKVPAELDEAVEPVDRALAAETVRRARAHRSSFDAAGSLTGRSSRAATLTSLPLAKATQRQPPGAKWFERLLTDATRGLSISWREVELEAPGGLSLKEGLDELERALRGGLPVPCVFGSLHRRPLRFALALQLSKSKANRAFQLYEPLSHELVWANARDLLTQGELPFDNKALRVLLRVALPREPRS